MEISKTILEKLENTKSGIIGVVGPNGSGKTKILNDLYKSVDSKNAGYINCLELDTNMIVKDYLNNIVEIKKYRIEEKEKRINDALLMVGLQGYLRRNINTLSLSEKVRLNLASMLIYNPKIMIIDEPFVLLDKESIKKLVHLLRLLKMRYHKKIVIATNNIDVLHKIVDYVYAISNEKIVLEGEKYDVFKETKKLKRYHIISPNVISFSNKILERKNIKIGYRDEINDLIKDIFRNTY